MNLRLFIPVLIKISILLTFVPSSIYGAIPLSERNALIAFYQATGGENWSNNRGWLGSWGSEANWVGVEIKDDHVTAIRLPGNGLKGEIPPEIEELPFLEELDFSLADNPPRFWFPSLNYIESIPSEIGKLTRLGSLLLSSNKISSLPAGIGGLVSLVRLDLSGNLIIALPAEIGDLTNLQELNLSNTGNSSIPPNIGLLRNLTYLDLGRNNLVNLPSEFAQLHNLEELSIGSNRFTTLPASICALENLRFLWASNGEIAILPDSIGNLRKLEFLDIDANKIEYLPPSFGNLVSLRTLRINQNQIRILPSEFGGLESLEKLLMMRNQVEQLPREIGNLKNLRELRAWKNLITSIPPEIGQLSSLEELYLPENQLEGPIPEELGKCRSLREIYFEKNKLSGKIPEQLVELKELERIELSSNQLSGPFPTFLTKLGKIKYIGLNNNRLSGPLQIGSLKGRLAGIGIKGNNLSGPFPFEIRNLAGLGYEYNALEIHDPAIQQYLDNNNPSWNYQKPSQTLPPDNLRIQVKAPGSVDLEWDPIYFTEYPGGYEIFYGETSGGEFKKAGTVPDKSVVTFQVTGLNPDKDHYFQIRSYTEPHDFNHNRVVSGFSNQVSTKAESEIRYWVPIIKGDDKTYTGLAFSNASMKKSHFDLAAVGSDGSLIGSFAESNRQEMDPGEQFAGLASEIFGFNPGSSISGWVELSTDHNSLASLFQIGTEKSLDGGLAFNQRLSKFFFTRVNGVESTQGKQPEIYLALANPNRESSTVRLRLYSGDLPAIETNKTLPPRGSIFAALPEIFGTFDPQDGFIEAFIVDGEGITGVQIIDYGEPDTKVVLPGRNDISGRFGYSAQMATGIGWFTSLNLANVGFSQRTVTIEAIRDDGSPIDGPVEVTLLARRGFQDEIRNLFNFSNEFQVGSLKVTADGTEVLADVIFGNPDLDYAAAMPLQKVAFESAWCSHVASSETLYTGIALFNISPGKTVVSIEVFTKDGIKIGETSIELKAGHRISRLISELIPSIENQMGGSIRITSTRPVIGQQFFGDRRGNYLSSVPPVY
jgi:Leucine-rich repeat (LRR) protein